MDSLPYIDKEYDDDSMKDVIERQVLHGSVQLCAWFYVVLNYYNDRLIAEEMEAFEPDDYLSMLPPVPALSLPEGSVLKSEFDRLATAPSSRMPKIDMTR